MIPARPASPRGSRDVIVLTLLFLLLVTSAWRAERARGVELSSVGATWVECGRTERDEDRATCLEATIDRLLASDAPIGDVLESVNAHARSDAWFSRRCHMVMHERGRRHEGPVTPGTIEHDGKDCAAGFLHGWMMEHLGTIDRRTVDAWCGPARTTLEHADCEHGMGHVVVRHLDGDLRAALRRCRTLGDQAFLRNCASGAFMENRFGGQARDGAARTSYWREGDPWLPCRAATPPDLRDACAAWAVRDLNATGRRGWCQRLIATTIIDGRACMIAAGGTAPLEQSARATCGSSTDCWFGRGFAWAIVGWDDSDTEPAALGCIAGAGALLDACARGVGFRRSASLAAALEVAAAASCDELFTGSARAACHDGAARRGEPIAYA